MSGYLPKDFIETPEGLIFAVVAAGEEEQRVLSFLRYQRSDAGFRKFSTAGANAWLAERHPAYLHYSKARDVNLHGVPLAQIAHHHQPRQRLRELSLSHSDDPWDESARLPIIVESQTTTLLANNTLLPIAAFRRFGGLVYPKDLE